MEMKIFINVIILIHPPLSVLFPTVVGTYALDNNLGKNETYIIYYCDFSLALLEGSMFVITSTGIKTCMAKTLE